MTEQSPRAIVDAYLDANARRDVDGTVRLFAEDLELFTPCVPPPVEKTIIGMDNIRAVYDMLFNRVFKSFRWARREVFECTDGQTVFALLRSDIELFDGRPYSNDYCFHARVVDGKIVEYSEFFDTTRAADAFSILG